MPECRALTAEEVTKTVGAFSGRHAVRNKCLFILGVTCGFKTSEMLALRVKDVMSDSLIKHELNVPSRMKDNLEGRTLSMPEETRNVLAEQVEALQAEALFSPEYYVFKTAGLKNQPINRSSVWEILQKAFKSVGIVGNVGCDSMRKTFAERAYAYFYSRLVAGEQIEPFIELSKVLGVQCASAYVPYSSPNDALVREAITQIGKRIQSYIK